MTNLAASPGVHESGQARSLRARSVALRALRLVTAEGDPQLAADVLAQDGIADRGTPASDAFAAVVWMLCDAIVRGAAGDRAAALRTIADATQQEHQRKPTRTTPEPAAGSEHTRQRRTVAPGRKK